jgi:hypothetical protein
LTCDQPESPHRFGEGLADFFIDDTKIFPVSGVERLKKRRHDESFLILGIDRNDYKSNRFSREICETNKITNISVKITSSWMIIDRIPRLTLEINQLII